MPVIIPPGGRKIKKKKIKGRPIKPARAVSSDYIKKFKRHLALMRRAGIIAHEGVMGGLSVDQILRQLNIAEQTILTTMDVQLLSSDVVGQANRIQKRYFEKMLANAFGVDVVGVIDREGIRTAVDLGIQQNVDLIKTVKDKYFKDVRSAVFDNFAGVKLPEGRTLLRQIQHIGGVSETRAKVIARDQTQKLNSTFNQVRQSDAGIERYIWRTAQDEAVVGTPGGTYPTGNSKHMNHFVREGKAFRWDEPPPDGHPGMAILCRCYAEPEIDREKILLMAA